MKTRYNVPIYSFCWLNHCDGGTIAVLYEPESKEELLSLCLDLYKEKKSFDIVGHTSNIYYMPDYSVDILVSTRKVRFVKCTENYIIADCGVSVSKLSKEMVNKGVKGFEGLVDLPGTVAASVYGNASCFGYSINQLLESCELLCPDGVIRELTVDELRLDTRSSALKRHEYEGVILSIKLKKQIGIEDILKKKADEYRLIRKATQPSASDNLGSIYKSSSEVTLIGFFVKVVAKLCDIVSKVLRCHRSTDQWMLVIVGGRKLLPYFFNWNRFIWKDEQSHKLFWRFHKLHQLLFKESAFEIEIKTNTL